MIGTFKLILDLVAKLNQYKLAADKGKEKKGRDDGAITIDKLIENLEGSMRTIWKFIHADKDACTTILTCRKEAHVELQNPSDSVLLMELRTDVQKVSFSTFHI